MLKSFFKKVVVSASVLSLISAPAFAETNTISGFNSQNTFKTYSEKDFSKTAFSLKMTDDSAKKTTLFGLPQNMGPIDRALRGLIAAGLIGTGVYGLTTGNIGKEVSWTLVGVSAIPVLTGATGYCPLYQLFGVDYSF